MITETVEYFANAAHNKFSYLKEHNLNNMPNLA
jgi:hypothetical protein